MSIYRNENILINSLNQGDIKAFEYLYHRYYNELCIYANSFVNNKALAEEFAQMVIISIWEKKPNLTINSMLKSYLYKATYNRFINYYRSQKKELKLSEELKHEALEYFAVTDDDEIVKKINLVKEGIDRLPKRCKEIFIMNKVQGMKYREIAEELNISIKTVEAQISTGLRLIKSFVRCTKNP